MIPEILRWRLTPKKKRLPLYCIVFVTYRCNSHCRTCFYHEYLNNPQVIDLPLSFYENLARSLNSLLWLHLSGGEPFLRSDLPQLVNLFYLHSQVRHIGIPTNGLLPDRIAENTQLMLKLCPEAQLTVVVSIDGLERTHNNLRGVNGSWQLSMQTIEKLKKLRSEFSRLSINICTVLNQRNAGEMSELLRFIQSMEVDFHDIGLMRGDFPDKNLSLPPIEEVRRILAEEDRYAAIYYKQSRHYPGFSANRALKTHRYLNATFLRALNSDRASQPCFTGDGFVVIEPNGDVRLCELTPVIGNVMEWNGDFKAFWNSETIIRARKEGLCDPRCCTHSNFQTRNFLLNPFQWWRALP